MTEKFEPKPVEGNPQSPEVEKTVTLPSQEEMLRRLRKAHTDPSLESKFFPSLLKEAGNMFNGLGIAMLLLAAVRDYIQKVYKGEKDMNSLEARALVSNYVPRYIDALVDDTAVVANAKAEVRGAVLHLAKLFPVGWEE